MNKGVYARVLYMRCMLNCVLIRFFFFVYSFAVQQGSQEGEPDTAREKKKKKKTANAASGDRGELQVKNAVQPRG